MQTIDALEVKNMVDPIVEFVVPVVTSVIYAGYGLLTNKFGNPEEKVDGVSLGVTLAVGAAIGVWNIYNGTPVNEANMYVQMGLAVPAIYAVTKVVSAIRKRYFPASYYKDALPAGAAPEAKRLTGARA